MASLMRSSSSGADSSEVSSSFSRRSFNSRAAFSASERNRTSALTLMRTSSSDVLESVISSPIPRASMRTMTSSSAPRISARTSSLMKGMGLSPNEKGCDRHKATPANEAGGGQGKKRRTRDTGELGAGGAVGVAGKSGQPMPDQHDGKPQIE